MYNFSCKQAGIFSSIAVLHPFAGKLYRFRLCMPLCCGIICFFNRGTLARFPRLLFSARQMPDIGFKQTLIKSGGIIYVFDKS